MKAALKTAAIDWQVAHRRIAAATQAMEDLLHPDAERVREILDTRAGQLAQSGEAQSGRGAEMEVVTFAVANERYALESRYVLEVLKLATITPIPRQDLLGVINLHGDILAVFDLRQTLGLPMRAISDLFRIMVLGQEQPEFGVLTDSVDEVCQLRLDAIRAAPVGARGRAALRGITSSGLIVLDGKRLLADERFYIHDGGQPGAETQAQEGTFQ